MDSRASQRAKLLAQVVGCLGLLLTGAVGFAASALAVPPGHDTPAYEYGAGQQDAYREVARESASESHDFSGASRAQTRSATLEIVYDLSASFDDPNGALDDFANHGGEFLDDSLRSPIVAPDVAGASQKIQRQMNQRGWTPQMVDDALTTGQSFPATNKLGGASSPATRYVDPTTGQSIVVDNATGEIVHVGGPGFLYD